MLDAISDFWKPAKKIKGEQEKLRLSELQIGSIVGFGFVPQSSLSGRRMQVLSINTYKFGDEALTSFVLSQDRDTSVSMIVAESDGEQYLAISRRMTISDRMKMFESRDLEDVMDKQEVAQLNCKDASADFKGWVVASYKRELQGLAGRLFKGDFRHGTLPADNEGQEFKYTLLVSDSNEHAIEIEKYSDGRTEVYSTVYRRMSDVGEVTHPIAGKVESSRPDLKLASHQEETKPAAQVMPPAKVEQPSLAFSSSKSNTRPEPIKLQEFPNPQPAKFETSKFEKAKTEPAQAPARFDSPIFDSKLANAAAQQPQKPAMSATFGAASPVSVPAAKTMESPQEKKSAEPAHVMNDSTRSAPAAVQNNLKPASSDAQPAATAKVQSNAPQTTSKQEIKAVTKIANGIDNVTSLEGEAIECDLRVANKIIDEAIRNEMRLSDVVRRIIELPVAYPEAVHIPISLTDEDFSLLAIRYGISSADRNAIKRRIIDDLNDFSGGKKQQSKAA